MVVAREGAGSTRVASRTAWYSSRICAEVRGGGGRGIGRGRMGAVGGESGGDAWAGVDVSFGVRARTFTAIFSFTLASCVGGRDACAPSNISCVRFTLRSVSSRIDRFATGASPEASGAPSREAVDARVETTTARGAVRGRASSKWSAGERGRKARTREGRV